MSVLEYDVVATLISRRWINVISIESTSLTLNQRHWRWFNVATTACAQWCVMGYLASYQHVGLSFPISSYTNVCTMVRQAKSVERTPLGFIASPLYLLRRIFLPVGLFMFLGLKSEKTIDIDAMFCQHWFTIGLMYCVFADRRGGLSDLKYGVNMVCRSYNRDIIDLYCLKMNVK